MRIVLYTQRVEIIKDYGERWDCADQNIQCFIKTCGYLPIGLPNDSSMACEIVERLSPVGIVLTGGNSLVKYGGNAPERDEMEFKLIEYAISQGIALYGFCRGMQIIADYFSCQLHNVSGHVAVRHMVSGRLGQLGVNSYHNQACRSVSPPLEILAQADDGVIESICCREKKILANMWHPEREVPFKKSDIKRVQNLFESGEI